MRWALGRTVLAVALLVVGVVAATTAVAATQRPTVKVVRAAGLGQLLATSSGLTLYHFTTEKRGSIACTGSCANAWPPLLVATRVKPTGAAGVTAARLGTIRRPDGRMQVTYNGLALYRYAIDRKAGDVKGQGVGGTWFVVSPAGKVVRRLAPAVSPPPASTPPPTETTPPGGGYDYG